MVGDVKQSIYQFRLARPDLFVDKYNTYTSEESGLQKIDLHQNFRSRGIVLMHDSYHCKTTLEALPRLIDGLREKGYALEPLDRSVTGISFAYADCLD